MYYLRLRKVFASVWLKSGSQKDSEIFARHTVYKMILIAIVFAVLIITLAFLVRQNTQTRCASNFRECTLGIEKFEDMVSRDVELNDIYQRGINKYADLSEVERVRFSMALQGLFDTYQLMFQLENLRSVDTYLYQVKVEQLSTLCSFPGVREWWKTLEHRYLPSFRNFIHENYFEGDS